MPSKKGDGRGEVKDPKNDGRLKDNRGGSRSSGGGSKSGSIARFTLMRERAATYLGAAHSAVARRAATGWSCHTTWPVLRGCIFGDGKRICPVRLGNTADG